MSKKQKVKRIKCVICGHYIGSKKHSLQNGMCDVCWNIR